MPRDVAVHQLDGSVIQQINCTEGGTKATQDPGYECSVNDLLLSDTEIRARMLGGGSSMDPYD